jgi:hypothetical protein
MNERKNKQRIKNLNLNTIHNQKVKGGIKRNGNTTNKFKLFVFM